MAGRDIIKLYLKCQLTTLFLNSRPYPLASGACPAAAGQRHSFSLSAVWGPTTAGTYETGLCGLAVPVTQAPNWNFGGEGYVTAQVLNP
jgi:hypothetical protein